MDVSPDVLAVLSAAEIQGSSLTLTGQLDRKLYERTNKVLEAAGGKWNRKAKAHVFTEDPAAVIDRVILTGEIIAPKDFGFFPSPAGVVDRILEIAELEKGMIVLEPSAGHGAIALAAHAAGGVVDCIELLPKNVAVLAAANLRVVEADFLTVTPSAHYDLVLMNPPFERQADIHHVMHARRFLSPHGRLVSVMSVGVTFRQDRLSVLFRELVRDSGGTFEPLPDGAFKSSGTMVRTVIVRIDGGIGS